MVRIKVMRSSTHNLSPVPCAHVTEPHLNPSAQEARRKMCIYNPCMIAILGKQQMATEPRPSFRSFIFCQIYWYWTNSVFPTGIKNCQSLEFLSVWVCLGFSFLFLAGKGPFPSCQLFFILQEENPFKMIQDF